MKFLNPVVYLQLMPMVGGFKNSFCSVDVFVIVITNSKQKKFLPKFQACDVLMFPVLTFL